MELRLVVAVLDLRLGLLALHVALLGGARPVAGDALFTLAWARHVEVLGHLLPQRVAQRDRVRGSGSLRDFHSRLVAAVSMQVVLGERLARLSLISLILILI